MRCILAATSSVLSAAAAAEFGPIGTVWNRPGVVCRLVPWSQISDPLLDSTLLPLQLSAYTPVCLSGLSVLPNHVCLSLLRPLLLICCYFCPSVSTSVCLLLFFFFFFVFHLNIACLSASLWSAACTWQMKTSTWAFTEDDSFDKFQTLIKGLRFKHCCLCETNNYCQLKITGFPIIVFLFWYLNKL